MKNVLEKRVGFIRKKIEEGEQGERGQYFIGKGIRLSVQDITAFASCVEEIFVTNEGVSRIIGSLANFDIRRSLQLSQAIVTSPHVKVDDLVKLYLTDGKLPIKPRQVFMGIICGESNHFSQGSSHFVMNIFEVQGDDLASPLLRLSVLRYFMDAENQSGQDIQAAHVSVEDAISYFDSMGIPASTVKGHIQRLATSKLLATYDASQQKINEDSLLRVTPSGKVHFEWATTNATYVTEAALTVPLRTCHLRDELTRLWSADGKKSRDDWDEFVGKFAEYCLEQDSMFCVVPATQSYKNQRGLRDQFHNRWVPRQPVVPAA
jgi:hypothetical protein